MQQGWSFPRAQANLLARNRLLDRVIEERAAALGLSVIEVDGSLTFAETERLVAERFAAAIVGEASERIWVITEADRSSSCILLPAEY